MQRRDLLKTAMAGAVSIALIGVQRACLADASFEGEIRNPFLTGHQRKTIATMAELIIPATDTPGAAAAAVPEFIELMLSDWYTSNERQPVVDGLAWLDAECVDRWQLVFIENEPARQAEILTEIQHGEFFEMIKALTVYGYYTSEVGATAELSFNPAPGRYTTIDFSEVGRQWVN